MILLLDLGATVTALFIAILIQQKWQNKGFATMSLEMLMSIDKRIFKYYIEFRNRIIIVIYIIIIMNGKFQLIKLIMQIN